MNGRNADRLARIQASPQWSGRRFKNLLPTPVMSGNAMRTMSRFVLERAEREPPGPLPAMSVDPSVLAGPASEGLRATWLGHSTVLLELGGFRVLTDPVWSNRIGPVRFGGPRRFQPVPVALAAIPMPDVVIVSHDHYDHLDRATVMTLASRGASFVTSLGVGATMESWGIPTAQITELDWWEEYSPCDGLRLRALPARHFSGRGVIDRNATLWSSWTIAAGRHRVYFGGDGGFDAAAFEKIGALCGPFDLTLLEIGAFDPAWANIHLGPENALRAQPLLGGDVLLPIHWGTFNLGLHAWDAPVEELLVAAQGTKVRLALPVIGQSVQHGETPPSAPWWRVLRTQKDEAIAPEAGAA